MHWRRRWGSTAPSRRRCRTLSEALIAIRDLSIGFTSRANETLPILRNIDLTVAPGETVGLVGESGSGKSTLALAMMGYLKGGLRVLGGSVHFGDHEMFSLDVRELEDIRGGKLALIPQNAGQSLTPTLRIGHQIDEALRLHTAADARERSTRALSLLEQVRLPEPEILVERYPHELSGGQQQRVAVAMALAGEPDALLMDEPTTGLDVTTQAHVLELLHDLGEETGTAMVCVSHDLGVIARVSDRVAVMYAGEVVLDGPVRDVLTTPAHPYARGLIASIPKLGAARLPAAMHGRPPPPGLAGDGCAFADRCPIVEPQCRDSRPALRMSDSGELTRCFLPEKVTELEGAEVPHSGGGEAKNGAAILTLGGVEISYEKPGLVDQLLGRPPAGTATVANIDIRVAAGETLGLVGESGSGKSTILKSVAGLLPPRGGEIALGEDEVLRTKVARRTLEQRRRVQLIFQNPDESLNPRHTVEEILAQPLRLYYGMRGAQLRERSVELLDRVRLGPLYLERLPSQLSGGEKQRVAVARAFAAEPDLVLCDEVTSALDVSVQAAVLDLLNTLQAGRGTTYIFVSHDLAVVRALADRVVVLYQGRICEHGPAEKVYEVPFHPYTEVLLGAVLEPVPGKVPKLLGDDRVEIGPPATGCPFQRRCPHRLGTICDTEEPPAQVGSDGHYIKCHIPLPELASKQAGQVGQ